MSIAIVTGATSGMGREAVFQLSGRFPWLKEIWVIGRRRDRLDKLESGVRLRILDGDLTKPEFIESIRLMLDKEKPLIAFLVNAAGYGKIGMSSEIDTESETGMVRLNAEALTAFCSIALPYMMAKSVIINFASAAAFMPQPGFAVYAATKSYVYSYSAALRQELKDRGIRVCAVCPGPVKTEFFNIAEENSKAPAYKNLFMAAPDKVVAKAIYDALRDKPCSVYGLGMNLFRVLAKLLPNELLFRLMKVF